MVPIYQFQEHCLCVSGEKKDLLTLAAYLRNAEGTLGDLRYQIEYAFDVDSVQSSNLEDPDHNEPECYVPEKDNAYPLCEGNGTDSCGDCCVYKDYDKGNGQD